MALNDIYQCSVIFSSPLADGEIVNVLHYRLSDIVLSGSEVGYAAAIASELEELYRLSLMPSISTQFTLDRVFVFNLNQPTVEFSFASGTVGSAAGESLGPRNSVVVSKKTGLRGRSFRGRLYLLPPVETNQADGSIISSYEATVQSFVDDAIILTIPNDNEYKLSVYSPTLSTPPTTIIANDVITMEVRSQIGTIRGRKTVRS